MQLHTTRSKYLEAVWLINIKYMNPEFIASSQEPINLLWTYSRENYRWAFINKNSKYILTLRAMNPQLYKCSQLTVGAGGYI